MPGRNAFWSGGELPLDEAQGVRKRSGLDTPGSSFGGGFYQHGDCYQVDRAIRGNEDQVYLRSSTWLRYTTEGQVQGWTPVFQLVQLMEERSLKAL
jgi:hypothetical protein